LFACVGVATAAQYRDRYPLPTNTVPDGLGVNIHFTDPAPGEMELIAKAGFKWVRMDFFWENIEKSKGVYDFSAYDRLMASLKKYKIRPIFILDYGNKLYQDGSPSEPEAVQAFVQFAKAGVRHFKGQGVVWEMWNEPNLGWFWKPTVNADQYAKLALAVGKAIREVAPQEWYVGPATSGFDLGFIETCFKAGLLEVWDAVTVHPYRGVNPETMVPDWAALHAMMKRYEPKKRIRMISGEFGYTDIDSSIGTERQGYYTVRQYLTNLYSGVDLSIWYDWKDDGTNPLERENHFGVVHYDLSPKPAYNALLDMKKALNGKQFVMRIAHSNPNYWIFAFRDRSGKGTALAWSTQDPVKLEDDLTPYPQVLPLDKRQRGIVDRAAAFVALPPVLIVTSNAELNESLKPLALKLRKGETLTVQIGSLDGMKSSYPTLTLKQKDLAKQLAFWDKVFEKPNEKYRLTVILNGQKGVAVPQQGLLVIQESF
jgi:hypothetical protein